MHLHYNTCNTKRTSTLGFLEPCFGNNTQHFMVKIKPLSVCCLSKKLIFCFIFLKKKSSPTCLPFCFHHISFFIFQYFFTSNVLIFSFLSCPKCLSTSNPLVVLCLVKVEINVGQVLKIVSNISP